MNQHYKIIFLNQRSSVFFQELARDIADTWHPSAIWTEIVGQFKPSEHLIFTPSPGYNRKNSVTRLISWFAYFFCISFKCLFYPRSLLFIVTMPPFLGLVGYSLKKIRGQKYVILVFDLHPDLLMKVGGLKNAWLIKLWRKMNNVVFSNADAVITIGEYMAQNLASQFDVRRTALGRVGVIPIWADVDWLKPLRKLCVQCNNHSGSTACESIEMSGSRSE